MLPSHKVQKVASILRRNLKKCPIEKFCGGWSGYPLMIPGDRIRLEYLDKEIEIGEIIGFLNQSCSKIILHRVIDLNERFVVTGGDYPPLSIDDYIPKEYVVGFMTNIKPIEKGKRLLLRLISGLWTGYSYLLVNYNIEEKNNKYVKTKLDCYLSLIERILKNEKKIKEGDLSLIIINSSSCIRFNHTTEKFIEVAWKIYGSLKKQFILFEDSVGSLESILSRLSKKKLANTLSLMELEGIYGFPLRKRAGENWMVTFLSTNPNEFSGIAIVWSQDGHVSVREIYRVISHLRRIPYSFLLAIYPQLVLAFFPFIYILLKSNIFLGSEYSFTLPQGIFLPERGEGYGGSN